MKPRRPLDESGTAPARVRYCAAQRCANVVDVDGLDYYCVRHDRGPAANEELALEEVESVLRRGAEDAGGRAAALCAKALDALDAAQQWSATRLAMEAALQAGREAGSWYTEAKLESRKRLNAGKAGVASGTSRRARKATLVDKANELLRTEYRRASYSRRGITAASETVAAQMKRSAYWVRTVATPDVRALFARKKKPAKEPRSRSK